MNIDIVQRQSIYKYLLKQEPSSGNMLDILQKFKINFNCKRDVFVQSDNLDMEEVKFYNSVKGEISSSLLDALNFEYTDLREDEDTIFLCGVEFSKDQIPGIPLSRCNEIKAENNVVSFENGKYYQYTNKDGETHIMACAYDDVACPHSEFQRGKHDSESWRIGRFWNIMANDGTYINLDYDSDEEKKFLNDAGITEGFFTIRTGAQQQEYFYSNGNCGTSILKARYDQDYDFKTNIGGLWLDFYEVGSIFVVDGKEYALSEKGTLDLPYGADIYNIKFPPHKARI